MTRAGIDAADRPLTIGLIIERLRGVGGPGLGLLEHLEQLLAGGHRVHLLAHGLEQRSAPPGCTVHSTDLAAHKDARLLVGWAEWIGRLHAEHHFDVLHSYGPYVPCNVHENRAGAIAMHMRRQIARRRSWLARAWYQMRTSTDASWRRWLAVERAFYRQPGPPQWVAISPLAADWLAELYGVDRRRVLVLPMSVADYASTPDERAEMRRVWRARLGLDEKACCLVFVGQIFRHKGLDFAIDAVSRYIRGGGARPIHLVAVGKDDPQPFVRKARQLGLADRVTILGEQRPMEPIYRAADALLYPTIADSYGRVILEALRAELPIITTRWAGAAYLVQQGQCGFVVEEPWDIEALADAISQVADPGRRADLVSRCRLTLAGVPSVAQRSQRLVQEYRRIAQADPIDQRLKMLDWLAPVR